LYLVLSKFRGIIVYNYETFQVERVIQIAESERQIRMSPSSIVVSSDDEYLFLTVWNEIGGGGYGSFFVVDLKQNSVLGEYPCGGYAQLAISPNNKYVYITDPAGYLRDIPSINKLLRYDVDRHEVEVFINSLSDIGLVRNRFITDKLIVADDNRTLFITFWSGPPRTSDGKIVHLIKLDSLTKRVISTFSLPLNEQGEFTQYIFEIKLGLYPN
jgi:hypothetical protein